MELPPGALEFIRAGTPQPVRPAGVPEVPAVVPSAPPAPAREAAPRPEAAGPKPVRARPGREAEPELLPPRNLVTLSIRVRPEIPDALLRAATERKLKRHKAHRQQEIAAEALTQWLTRHGYLDE